MPGPHRPAGERALPNKAHTFGKQGMLAIDRNKNRQLTRWSRLSICPDPTFLKGQDLSGQDRDSLAFPSSQSSTGCLSLWSALDTGLSKG